MLIEVPRNIAPAVTDSVAQLGEPRWCPVIHSPCGSATTETPSASATCDGIQIVSDTLRQFLHRVIVLPFSGLDIQQVIEPQNHSALPASTL